MSDQNSENKKQVEIIPTVMPESYDDFVEKIDRVADFVKTVQIDVMDGKFVPSTSWPYNSQSDQNWQDLVDQNKGIPHWQELDFEIDLMVENQIEEAKNWISAGVSRAIFHIEALKPEDYDEILKIKEEGTHVAFALIPETPNSELDKYLDIAESVQFMGINKIGYQGQEFEPKVLEKIAELRAKKPDLPISVDGGVSFETAKDLANAGATRLSSGSTIFKAENTKRAIENLRDTVN
jgi:ribulose-phosphate 3-epimerase